MKYLVRDPPTNGIHIEHTCRFPCKFQAQFLTDGRHAINRNWLLSVDSPRADWAMDDWQTVGKRLKLVRSGFRDKCLQSHSLIISAS